MMAFDRTPGPALDPATLAELRACLVRAVQQGDHDQELRVVLAKAAAEARGRGVLAEQLLLALKDVWYSLPQVTHHTGSEVHTRLLQQLIARCIQEYYAN
jgi:hypothetical protein